MKKKKVIISQNYLERVPMRSDIKWSVDAENVVTLEIENSGASNWIAQKLFRRPKTSYVHLDKFGSVVWQSIDGESDIIKIGESVKEHYTDEPDKFYATLAQYFRILDSYHFIQWK